jgi:hypothetical protein
MLSSVLLLISVTALLQFALYYWRSVVAGVAAQPIPDRVFAAAASPTAVSQPAILTSSPACMT